jgi:hypothetical protein
VISFRAPALETQSTIWCSNSPSVHPGNNKVLSTKPLTLWAVILCEQVRHGQVSGLWQEHQVCISRGYCILEGLCTRAQGGNESRNQLMGLFFTVPPFLPLQLVHSSSSRSSWAKLMRRHVIVAPIAIATQHNATQC